MSVILTAYKGERLLYNVMLGSKEFASLRWSKYIAAILIAKSAT